MKFASRQRPHSQLSLAQQIRHFAFVMTMLIVLTLGGGMLALTLNDAPHAEKKANQDTVTVIGEVLSADVQGQLGSLMQLAENPMTWTALTDSAGREAYLKPFLIARERIPFSHPVELLDYKGRHVTGKLDALIDQTHSASLASAVLMKRQQQIAIVQSGTASSLLIGLPVLFPYTKEVIGVLVSTVELKDLFRARTANLGSDIVVDLTHRGHSLVGLDDAQPPRYSPAEFALNVPVSDGAEPLIVTLSSTRNPWLWPALRQFGFALAIGLILGVVTWKTAGFMAKRITRRLDELTSDCLAIADERLVVVRRDDSPDEIGILSRTLNRALEAHREITLNLERMVEQKTSALSQSEQRFRSIFEKNHSVMMIIDPHSGRIVSANPAASSYYGYTPDEFLHILISDINCMPPARIAEQMQAAEKESRNYFLFEHKLKSGEHRQVEVYSTPIPTNDGSVLFSIIHDVTERVKAEARLRISDQALMAISQGVVVSDATGMVLSVNGAFCRITGYSPEETLGQRCQFLQGEQTDPGTVLAIQRCKDLCIDFDGEILNYRKNGQPFWNEMSISPVLDASGQLTHFIGVIRDSTERKNAEDRLKLAANVFTYAREGIMITSVDGTIIDVNSAFSQITGFNRDEAIGANPRMLSSGRHDQEFYAAMWHDMLGKGHWYGEVWNRRKTGDVYVQMLNTSAVRNQKGEIEHFVALFSDITALKEHEQQLEYVAHYDPLTGLANRVLLADRLKLAMLQAVRRGQQLAVVYLDLDGFKAINDMHGHGAGDRLLMLLANRMKQVLREGDTLARIGGDEFVGVLIDLPDSDVCLPVLSRLLAAASLPVTLAHAEVHVSASLGVTFFPQTEDVDADQLLRQADQAMYEAKLLGKNRYHIFDTAQAHSVRSQHETLEYVRRALVRNEFVLHYQPKINMVTGQVIGLEALIRWQHPEKGLIFPLEFLPMVEDHALSIGIGEWVISSVLRQMDAWQRQGQVLQVSVNLGARQLQADNFLGRLRELLGQWPAVHPSCLEVEILETSALRDFGRMTHLIETCRELGVTFDLDDFGTGYSSLTYVKRLPIHRLKIDQSFVRGMLESQNDRAILQAVISLSSALGHEVIAEGVETVEHGVHLLQLGCEFAQGYGIARPMPAHEVLPWINNWKPHPQWQRAASVSV